MVNYDFLFSQPEYNLPNKKRIAQTVAWVNTHKYKDVLDVGCGRGHYLKVTGAVGLEPSHYLITHDLKKLPVTESDILSYDRHHEALYCMDVLEHLEPGELKQNLEALARISKHALYGIANHPDYQSDENRQGIDVHPIQENSEWWHEKLSEHYSSVNNLFDSERYFIFEAHNV